MDKDLLLGDTARTLEIMEFESGGNSYGIDVNDIREILPFEYTYIKVPNAHPYVEGIIKPRDFLIPIINLQDCLKLEAVGKNENEMLIVTSINNLNIGFHVDNVIDIHRSTTKSVKKPGKKISTTVKEAVVGILCLEDHNIEILELRTIISKINPEIEF